MRLFEFFLVKIAFAFIMTINTTVQFHLLINENDTAPWCPNHETDNPFANIARHFYIRLQQFGSSDPELNRIVHNALTLHETISRLEKLLYYIPHEQNLITEILHLRYDQIEKQIHYIFDIRNSFNG